MSSIKSWTDGVYVRWDVDDWESGLANTYGSGSDTRFAKGFNLASAVDPYRRYGYIGPGYAANDATNAGDIDAILKSGISNGDKAYCIEAGAQLHEVTVATAIPSVANTGSWPHTISAHGGHASVVGEDVALYYLNGTKYLFYSWNDDNDGDIGRFDLTSTFDDDYVSSAATSGAVLNKDYPHPMIVGDDNILYVGDGNNLASLQGTTSAGIWNPSALDLPDGYIITSFAKTPIYLVVYAYRNSGTTTGLRGEATAFYWDYRSESFTYAIPLAGNYVNGGFTVNGVPGCFVFGKAADNVVAKQSKMLLQNGPSFDTIVDFNDDIPGHGGVEVTGNSIVWNSEGEIYAYGTPFIGNKRALNKISKGDGTTGEGMLRNFNGASLIGSSGSGTSGGLNYFQTGFAAGALLFTGQVDLPSASNEIYEVAYVKVGYYGTIDDADGTEFNLAINSDSSNQTIDSRGSLSYVYESNGSAAVIDKVVKIYKEPSGVTTTGQFTQVSNSLGLVMSWPTNSTNDTAPFVGFVEVYLRKITQNVTDES